MANEQAAAPPDIAAVLNEIRDALKARPAADPQPAPAPAPMPVPVPVPVGPAAPMTAAEFRAIPKSWMDFANLIFTGLGSLLGIVATIVGSLAAVWAYDAKTEAKGAKEQSVVNHVKQDENTKKLEKASKDITKVATDTDVLRDQTDELKGIGTELKKKTERIGSAVGAKPMDPNGDDAAPAPKVRRKPKPDDTDKQQPNGG